MFRFLFKTDSGSNGPILYFTLIANIEEEKGEEAVFTWENRGGSAYHATEEKEGGCASDIKRA